MKHYVYQLASGFEMKALCSIVAAIVTKMEGFYGELLWGFLALFGLDLITGIVKSIKNGVPISSRRLRDSVTKLGAYMILLTALIVTSKYEASFQPIVAVTYYYFIFTEFKSILENVEEMGVKLPPVLKSKVQQQVEEVKETVETIEQKVDVIDEKVTKEDNKNGKV